MTFAFSEKDGQTIVELTYTVSGRDHLKLDKIAGPVDGVLKIQLDRFQKHCNQLATTKHP